MLELLPPEAVGLAVVVVLVLLPGLLLVRAPWTAVPALSVAFWVLAWWWVRLEGRTRQLAVALPVLGLLLLLRLLPRHAVPPPPGYTGPPPEPAVTGPVTGHPPRFLSLPSLFVLAVGVAVVSPLGLWSNPPGTQLAFHTTASRLAVWRDALPSSYEPLLPLGPFGVRGPALATLAADVSLLSGLEPPAALVAVILLAVALVLLGLYALAGTRLSPGAAALGAVLGLGAVRWPGVLTMWGEGGSLLALALALPAAALMVGHTSRPSAVGAGFLWAGASLAQPWLTLAVGAVTALAGPVVARRWILAFAVAAVLAAPPLVRLTGVLSVQETLAALGSLSPAEVTDFLLGVGIVVLSAAVAERVLAPRSAASRHGAVQAQPETDAGFYAGENPGTGKGQDREPAQGQPSDESHEVREEGRLSLGSRIAAVALGLVGASLLVLRVHAWFGAGQLPLADRVELARLARLTSHADVVCAPPGFVDWVPAIAARAVGGTGARPWVPPSLREESTAQVWPACTRKMDAPRGPAVAVERK